MPTVDENIERVVAFYAVQAPEYHEVAYGPNSEKVDYHRIKSTYETMFAGLNVLEMASGSGYWTDVVSRTAASIVATDINPWLVERLKEKFKDVLNVSCQVADVYKLDNLPRLFSGAYAQFWLSHVPRTRLAAFFQTLHGALQSGAQVAFSDHVECYSTMKRRVDEHGDIYEERILQDGTRLETIKNFFTETELATTLADVADDFRYVEDPSEPLWTLTYRVRKS